MPELAVKPLLILWLIGIGTGLLVVLCLCLWYKLDKWNAALALEVAAEDQQRARWTSHLGRPLSRGSRGGTERP